MDNELNPAENINARKSKFPVGMIVLLFYLGYVFVIKLVSLWLPVLFFGPFLLPKSVVFIYYLISVIIIAVCFWTVLKRKKWGRKLIIGWFGFGAVYVIVSDAVSLYFNTEYLNIYRKVFGNTNVHTGDTMLIISTLILPLILVVAVSSVIIWYVYTKKGFFVN